MADDTTDEEQSMKEGEKATVTKITAKNPGLCEKCLPGETPAEWTFKAEAEPAEKMCDGHARWWYAEYGYMTFPGDD